MPYDFGSRDLGDPRETRAHVDPPDELRAAYEEWAAAARELTRREIELTVSGPLYELAVDVLEGCAIDGPEVSALLLAYRDDLAADVGLFVSAAYNRSDDDVLVFDADVPAAVQHLGYRLPAEKALVVDAGVYSAPGVGARGLLVNRATVERQFGYGAGGAYVNCGSCLTFGFGGEGLRVNFGEVRSRDGGSDDPVCTLTVDDTQVTVTRADLDSLPAVADALDDVEAGLTGDAEAVQTYLAGLDPAPRRGVEDAIRAPVEDALRRGELGGESRG